jgi:hypothetical protein
MEKCPIPTRAPTILKYGILNNEIDRNIFKDNQKQFKYQHDVLMQLLVQRARAQRARARWKYKHNVLMQLAVQPARARAARARALNTSTMS